MKQVVFLICVLACSACSTVQFATREQWEWQTDGYAVSSGGTLPLRILGTDNNMENCSAEDVHLLTAANSVHNNTVPYVAHVLSDLPFKVDSVLCVLGEQIVVFEQRNAIALAPDYEIQPDSAVFCMRGEVFRPTSQQRADVIWRNLFVDKHEKRVVCLDRFYLHRRHIGVLYILQSRTSTLRAYHAQNWCGLLSWDATDTRCMMGTAAFLDSWKEQSLDILHGN